MAVLLIGANTCLCKTVLTKEFTNLSIGFANERVSLYQKSVVCYRTKIRVRCSVYILLC
jgi:hypothetical protein